MWTGPASTPGPFAQEPLRPRTYWFWIGGLLIATGVVGAAFWFVGGLIALSNAIGDLERVPFPDGGTVMLDDAGGYVVYAEGSDVFVPGGTRIVVADPDGEPVASAPYGGSLTYDLGGHSGTAVATFDAPAPGAYRVAALGAGSGFAEELAVGPSFAGDLVRTLVGAFAIGGVGVTAGVVIIIVTAARRSRARRRPRTPAYQRGQPPPSEWSAPPGGPFPG